MSAITTETVKHVANLARLALTDEEILSYTTELSNILNMIEEINQLDLSSVDMTLDAEQPVVFSTDDPIREFSRESLMANAPSVEDHFFRVPKILSDA
jgi:aspartyl-tRNA(Asn)/glutamyl-tRNA(Gln) amidotransferase subunit C